MALVKCSECGAEISDKAAACVKCGAPHAKTPPSSRVLPTRQEMTKPVPAKEAFALLVVAGLVVWAMFEWNSPSESKPATTSAAAAPTSAPPKPAAVAAAPAVDFSRPVFTTEGGVICPIDRVLDDRLGHTLKDATQAAMQVFGRTEKLREVGCEVLRDGVPVQVKPPEADNVAWLESTAGPYLYWRFSLRN
jgi:hypothetical protein